jgi:site-specific DNA-methyltransferase (adenine-specific)
MQKIGWRVGPERCWYKQNAVGKNALHGSVTCSSPSVNRNHEYLMTFYKGEYLMEGDDTLCDLSKDESLKWSQSFWYIPPETKSEYKEVHPAVYPEELVYRLVKLNTRVGDIVFDPYSGSGTTAFVAAALGRNFLASETGPTYCELAAKRIARLDGLLPEEREKLIRRYSGPAHPFSKNAEEK